jgi:MinD-like ATPase involved in chromosome partitioning or flagellar assembly
MMPTAFGEPIRAGASAPPVPSSNGAPIGVSPGLAGRRTPDNAAPLPDVSTRMVASQQPHRMVEPAPPGAPAPSVAPVDAATVWRTTFPVHVHPPRSVPREFGRGGLVDQVWLRAASLRPGCPLVVVSSADGGVGRSTLVAALGGVLALASPRPVLAMDLSGRAWGGLVHRVGSRGTASVWDAVQAGDRLAEPGLVDRYVQRGTTGLRALVGEVQMTSARRPPNGDETAALVGRLRALYPLALLDAPPADTAATWRMLTWATAPVLVARATQDSLQHTMRLLTQLRAVGLAAIADRSVLVVVASTQTVAREVKAAEHQAAGVSGALVRVPYDPTLARPEPVDVRSLRRPTRSALVEVASAVLALCPADPEAAASAADPATWHDEPQGEEI